MLLAPALVVSLSSVLGLAGPDADVPLGFPITSDTFEPEVMGFGHGGALHANEPTILFVNFDGAQLNSGCGNNPKNNCSTMSWTFGGLIKPYSGDAGVRASLVQGVRSDFRDFAIAVTDTRPSDSEDYAMVLVGESANGGSDYHGFAGVAPTIDCGNSNPNITSFDLVGSVTVINQEAAHTWGLEHVNEKADNLYPTSGGVADPQYLDMCMKIVSNTMLDPSNGQCNSVHTQFCNSGWQNSYQEMLYLFGMGGPDTIAPGASIDYPAQDEVLPYPADFNLEITLSDNQSPQLMDTVISFNGTQAIAGNYIASTLKFPVSGLAEGSYTVLLETEDEDGNPASDEVTFHVGMAGTTTDGSGTTTDGSGGSTSDGGTTSDSGGGSTTDPSTTDPSTTTTSDGSSGGGTDGDSDGMATGDDSGCSCTSGAPGGGSVLPLFVLLLAARRRR